MQGSGEDLSADLSADLQLLAAVRSGDRGAFATFVRRHEVAVRRFLRTIVDDADAADAAQETFLQVWRAQQQPDTGFRGEGSARSWLFTIARRVAWRRSRRRAGEPPVYDDVGEVDAALGVAAGWGDNPEAALQHAESRAAVRAALARLPDADREILALRDMAGVSGADVAAALGLSLAAEKSRLHRARLLMMKELRSSTEMP